MMLKHRNIINHIKALRLSWFGHVQRMPDSRRVLRKYLNIIVLGNAVINRKGLLCKLSVLEGMYLYCAYHNRTLYHML